MTVRSDVLDAAGDLPPVKERAVFALIDIRQRDLGEWSA